MVLGCLTGNGKQDAIEGTYTYRQRGKADVLPPDLQSDKADASGAIAFSAGSLTDGKPDTIVGWNGNTLREMGVDIVFDLKGEYFIDRVIIHQVGRAEPELPTPDKFGNVSLGEVPDYVEPAGLNYAEVYVRLPDGNKILAGKIGRKRHTKPMEEQTISIDVGLEATEVVVRIDSFNRDLFLSGIELWGASTDEPALYPIPQKINFDGEGAFELTDATKIVLADDACDDSVFSAALLMEKVKENFDISIEIVREHEVSDLSDKILIAKPGASKAVDATDLPQPRKEGYSLKVSPETVFILAADRRGLIYAVETFLQLLSRGAAGKKPAAQTCLIEDYPHMEFRGVHLFMPHRDDIPFIKNLIRYVLAPMKMNTIFLQVTAGMQFDRRPEINQTWERVNREAAEGKRPYIPHAQIGGGSYLTKDEVRDIVNYAKSYGFEVIPEVQSLSHVEYLTATYPEIAENPNDTYPDCYCPLHPESHKIVFDMIDEVIEVFQPERYISMGHDEAYTMGVCPRCKGKSRAELFALDVNKIYDYLKSKGLGMMIWADMVQDFRPYGVPDAIDMIPKDIVMLDFVWYFATDRDIETRLIDHGFKVIMGNFYSSHYPRFTSRSRRQGVIGAEVSTWCRSSEEDIGAKGKLYDFIYSANMMWTEHYTDELRWTMDRKINQMMPLIRSQISKDKLPVITKAKSFTPVDISSVATAPRRDNFGSKGGYDISNLPAGRVTLNGVPFEIPSGLILVESPDTSDRRYPESVEIPINLVADSLVLLHTCSSDTKPSDRSCERYHPSHVGTYEIVYDDGTSTALHLDYGWQLAEWNRRHGAPLKHISHRHTGYIGTYPSDAYWQGKMICGEDVTIYGLEWANPHPEKKIKTLHIKAAPTALDTALITVGITAVNYR